MCKFIVASMLLLSCFLLSDVYAQTKTFGDWEAGVSSFFSNIDEGSCSFGTISTSSFPYGYTMAPNSAIYRDSDACGGCYEVQCINGVTEGCECRTDSTTNKNVIVTVMVTQECPACIEDDSSQNEFQLSEAAFSTITSANCGAINMQYRQVSCDISNNIIIHNTADGGQDSYGLYVSNVANYGEISKVEIKDSEDNAAWIVGDKSVNDNSYVFTSSGELKLPFSVRLTDSGENVLTASDIITTVTASDEFDFGDNFDVTNLITIYQIHIPICINGFGYDNYATDEAIVEAAKDVFAGYDDNDYGIVDTSVSTGDDEKSFNVTLLVETEVPLPVTRAALNGTLCKAVGPALDSGASCSVCDEIITDTVEREDSQDEDTYTATNDNNNEDASCPTSVTLMVYLIGIGAYITVAIGL